MAELPPPAQKKKGPQLDIKGKVGLFSHPKNENKKLTHSFFACLLNTNYHPKSNEEAQMMAQEYPTILEDLLKENADLFRNSITVVDKIDTHADFKKTFHTHRISEEEFDENIKRIRSRFKCEMGAGKGRFHLHATFFVVHTTKIQMDLKPIIDAYNVELTSRGLHPITYFHTKSEKPNTDLYMSKYDFKEEDE